MAKIYVSYTTRDDDYAQQLMTQLQEFGHIITIQGTKLLPGINWRAALNDGLKSADVFIMLISQSTMHSQYPMMELGIARAYAEHSGKLLIIPVILGELPLPNIVQDIQVIFARDLSPGEIVLELNNAISSFEGKLAAQEVVEKEVNASVQLNLADFVLDAIETQQGYEKSHKTIAERWYFAGFTALIGGLITTAYLVQSLISSQDSLQTYAKTISLSLLNLVAIALLAALARYAYSLGKSYMSESLKCSDRIHAIQFGKFFLHAFGSRASTAEVKEVFQHWNIDRTSTFSSLDSAQIDPQVFSMMVQLCSTLLGKNK